MPANPAPADPNAEFIILLVVAIAVLCLLILGVLTVVESYLKFRMARHNLAAANENFTIRARVVYSNQTSSTQPVVIVNVQAQSKRLFRWVGRRQSIRWKRWVAETYPFGPFPYLVDGQVHQ